MKSSSVLVVYISVYFYLGFEGGSAVKNPRIITTEVREYGREESQLPSNTDLVNANINKCTIDFHQAM